GMSLPHTLSSTVCAGPPLGTGTAWADYDNDGDIDVFVVNNGAANWLYRNDGDTSGDGLPDYTNVAVAAGVDDPAGVSHAAVFIDYDNDGDQDLYVTNWDDGTAVHGNILYENQLIESGSATFTDVTATAGLADDGRAITSGWADYDQDGYLDVYLAKHTACGSDPAALLQDHLYHNNGDGTFTDVSQYLCTSTGGVLPCPTDIEGRGFMPGWFDFDNDGDQDLYLVNDWNASTNTNRLWRNDGSDGSGGWTFVEISATAGVSPAEVNGMGLGIGDPNNDGWLDLAFSDVGLAWLYLNDQDGTFTDISSSAGMPAGVTWGTAFFDYDNDGWEDLFLAGGSIHDPVNNPADTMLRNRGGEGFVGQFDDVSTATGLNHTGRGRAVSTVDFDQDGHVDLMVGNYGQDYRLYRNYVADEGNTNHWLTVTVEGTASNRDAIGARIILTTSAGTQIREINSGWNHGGGSYRAAYFGLGTDTSGTLEIRWPDGTTQVIGAVTADQALHYVEP
ncbi:MAG: CRTAC1 family protein, partial [Anaerolineales bacterium]|nr:CRTAC1 family protein [Anaerolineales bacterium]